MLYGMCMLLVLIGLYGVLVKKNVVKIVVCLAVVEYGVNLLLVLIGYRSHGTAPVLADSATGAALADAAVDPLPQALVLTSIVIGLAVLALLVALCIRLYERYGTFDVTAMRRLKG